MIQVYTGNGKGKTTASLGLALRAAGAGLRVYIAQFLKGGQYNELNSLRKISNIDIEQFGRGCFIGKTPAAEDIAQAKSGLEKIKKIISQRAYDLVILDEINIALDIGLLELKEVISLIKEAPKNLELVLTGRYAPRQILGLADLVSEVKEIKHYFKKGIKARKGIEF